MISPTFYLFSSFDEIRLLLPYSLSRIEHYDTYPIDSDNLPRRTLIGRSPVVLNRKRVERWIIMQARIRTASLLHNLDKLRDEVQLSWSRTDKDIRDGKIKEIDWDEWEKKLLKSLEGARRVQFREDIFSEEILENQLTWNDHVNSVRAKHSWGQYLRSNLDWDWDPSKCLHQLFKL